MFLVSVGSTSRFTDDFICSWLAPSFLCGAYFSLLDSEKLIFPNILSSSLFYFLLSPHPLPIRSHGSRHLLHTDFSSPDTALTSRRSDSKSQLASSISLTDGFTTISALKYPKLTSSACKLLLTHVIFLWCHHHPSTWSPS